MANLTGRVIGKVKITEFIARGGMAEVYLGEHIALNRKVAVKVMRDQLDSDLDARLRFEREARVVAGLRHPNIIQVFDYEIVGDQPCLVMEYAPGASLGEYLKELHKRGEKLPYNIISRLLTSLASAIDYAHTQNIVHRDIKPGNVLLRSASGEVDITKPLPDDVEPILTDFGLVRLLDASMHTSIGTVSGTPAYMSPEQARGDKVDKRTDIYSLGVMLYEMLAGDVPFGADTSFGVLMKHINEPPPPISAISSDVQAIIYRTLAKDPELRYQTAKELADEFNSVFNGQTISPGTLKISKIAHQTINTQINANTAPSWVWKSLTVLAVLALGFVAYQIFSMPQPFATLPIEKPTPTLDPAFNQSVGRVDFVDLNAAMDKAVITLSGVKVPQAGFHYEAWFLSQGGEVRRKAGAIEIKEETKDNVLEFTSPNDENILGAFDNIEITIEPNNDPNPDVPSTQIVASSVLPPLALIHIRHLDVAFGPAPGGIGLIQGVENTTKSLNTSVQELQVAFNDGNEDVFRKKIEEIINQSVGNANASQYKDWNNDGTIDDPSDGYGLLQNGEPGYNDQGYILQMISHAKFAAQAVDATDNIKMHSEHVVICGENITGWTRQLLKNALALQEMPFGPDMSPTLDEMKGLSDQIITGVDGNGNKAIEPIPGEGGVKTAYKHAYFMAKMFVFPGANRIPPPAPTSTANP